MSNQPGDWIRLLQEIADLADAVALDHFRSSHLRVEQKSDASPVTEADRRIEEAARALLRDRLPGVGVFGEEFGEAGTSETRLIIDPIDGTRNFVRGIPVFATLLAIEEQGGVTAGLVSAPALGRRWHAARGAGAFAGDRRLKVSGTGALELATIFHGDLSGHEGGRPLPPGLTGLMARAERTRGFGDFYQHLLVAEGCGELAVDPDVKPWDIAPVQVIVEEAGGRATTLTGERSIYGGSLVSSNRVLHDEILRALEEGP